MHQEATDRCEEQCRVTCWGSLAVMFGGQGEGLRCTAKGLDGRRLASACPVQFRNHSTGPWQNKRKCRPTLHDSC
eukprot:11966682-Alexandrium_andersonii.AAC.1